MSNSCSYYLFNKNNAINATAPIIIIVCVSIPPLPTVTEPEVKGPPLVADDTAGASPPPPNKPPPPDKPVNNDVAASANIIIEVAIPPIERIATHSKAVRTPIRFYFVLAGLSYFRWPDQFTGKYIDKVGCCTDQSYIENQLKL